MTLRVLRGGRNLFSPVNCVEIFVKKEDFLVLGAFESAVVLSAVVAFGFAVTDASVVNDEVMLGDDKPASVETIPALIQKVSNK